MYHLVLYKSEQFGFYLAVVSKILVSLRQNLNLDFEIFLSFHTEHAQNNSLQLKFSLSTFFGLVWKKCSLDPSQTELLEQSVFRTYLGVNTFRRKKII